MRGASCFRARRASKGSLACGAGSGLYASRLSQSLLLVEILERLDELTDFPGDDGVELVKRQVDAMVGQAVLRKVVGADAFAAVAGADEGAALLGAFLVQALPLHFMHAAAEDAQGPFVVLVL